jgi:SAM-dependent methyltransferase
MHFKIPKWKTHSRIIKVTSISQHVKPENLTPQYSTMESDRMLNTNTDSRLEQHALFIKSLAQKGGPQPEDYAAFDNWLRCTQSEIDDGKITVEQIHGIWRSLGEDYLRETVQGHTLSKPRGYLGDFITIDRMYTSSVTSYPHFANWDRCVHAQVGVIAMRKRKDYLLQLLFQLESENRDSEFRVLNLGSGPGRDVSEYFTKNPQSKALFQCVDQDAEAIKHARSLCANFLNRIEFHETNVFRYKAKQKFHLVWSAGLFDYLNDALFRRLLKRLLPIVNAGGAIVIANFSDYNPSRAYMELIGGWYLVYRSKSQITQLALDCGVQPGCIEIRSTSDGIIHFLHIRM